MIENFKLVNELRENDRQAFDLIYSAYFTRLVKFSFSYTKDLAIAENLSQDAFIKLWEKRAELKPDTNLLAFLLTIVKNGTLNYLKRQKIKIRVEGEVNNYKIREVDLQCQSLEMRNPDLIFSKEITQILHKAIAELPEQTRKVLILRHYDYLSNKQIAEKLGITVKGVEFHVTKASKVLKMYFKDYLPILFLIIMMFEKSD